MLQCNQSFGHGEHPSPLAIAMRSADRARQADQTVNFASLAPAPLADTHGKASGFPAGHLRSVHAESRPPTGKEHRFFMANLLLQNGSNPNLPGAREPGVYGSATVDRHRATPCGADGLDARGYELVLYTADQALANPRR